MNEYDVAVIGGGAAGLSAALVLSRARRSVVVIDAGSPRNAAAAQMQGFLSRDGMPPTELLAIAAGEVAGYGGRLVRGTVSAVEPHGHGGFEVTFDSEDPLLARRVLVTTGLHDEVPEIPGVRERWGRDLLHCPYCHGYEVRDQALGVLGGTPEAVQHALVVRQWSDDVVYFNHDGALTTTQHEQLVARAIGVVDGHVTSLVVEDDRLTGIRLANGTVVPRRVVFVRPTFVPSSSLLTGLGCATRDDGWVATDSTGLTSVPGVWAAGNAVNPRAQVITAAGEGSTAAIAINNDLVAEDTRLAVEGLRLGLA